MNAGDIALFPGDNRESLRKLIAQGVRVHSVVTDPPYALTSITKRFGGKSAAPARVDGNDGSFARLSSGFMGKKWDATGIERDPEFWRLIFEILLPGGYVFAFSGARTGHWQAGAMEQAGFIMHPMHGWVYGSGWPKPTYAPDLPEWEGWGYGTQSQKPALEPIYLGQRPFSEKGGVANIVKHGVGAVNINGCRVGDRSPSNLILDGSPDVVGLFPHGKSGKPGIKRKGNEGACYGAESREPGTNMVGYGDEGSNARFFHQFALAEEDYQRAIDAGVIGEDRGDAIVYHAKANKIDRAGSKHPTVKPIGLVEYLVRHITPPGGIVLDPFAGTGTTAEAARRQGFLCIVMESEPEYVDFLVSRLNLDKKPDIGINSLTEFFSAKSVSSPAADRTNFNLIDILGDEEFQKPRSVSGNDLADLLL